MIFKVVFLGGVLIGDMVGFVNVFKVKGMYNVMKSGMLVVEVVWNVL